MELDDLKVAWTQLEQRVEQAESIVRRDYEERKLGESRRTIDSVCSTRCSSRLHAILRSRLENLAVQ